MDPRSKPEPRSRESEAFAEASKALHKLRHARMPAAEKKQLIDGLQAARRTKFAAMRAHGESVDFIAPERRREIGRLAGRASAAARLAHMTADERKQLGNRLAAGRAAAAARRLTERISERQWMQEWVRKHAPKAAAPLAPPEICEPSEPSAAPSANRIAKPSSICVDGEVRLPRSATRRGGGDFLKLLERVEPDRAGGFYFEGKVLVPGATIRVRELSPAGLVLECVGTEGGRGHNRGECVWVLWRFDRASGEWKDLAQSRSVGREWSDTLGPLAVRALAQQQESGKKHHVDDLVLDGIDKFLNRVEALDPRVKQCVVDMIRKRI